jgi:hypothetical protein
MALVHMFILTFLVQIPAPIPVVICFFLRWTPSKWIPSKESWLRSDTSPISSIGILDPNARITCEQMVGLGRRVFDGKWTATQLPEPPSMKRARWTPATILVGTFNQDLKCSDDKKQSPHRKCGKPAYLQAMANDAMNSISYQVEDAFCYVCCGGLRALD